MAVTYLTTPIVDVRHDPPPLGSGMTRDGYTKRSGAPTSRMIRLQGEKRWRRLMIWQFSNMGTLFVNLGGVPYVVPEHMIPEEGAGASDRSLATPPRHATRKPPVNIPARRARVQTRRERAAQLDREIAAALGPSRERPPLPPRERSRTSHATRGGTGPRWSNRAIATAFDVPEDIVRRIYTAVQTAKRQGLYGGHTADLIERAVGRKLIGAEHDVATRAKYHLSHDPPGGYGGPEPKGSAKPAPRPKYDDPKIGTASRMTTHANTTINRIAGRWDESFGTKDREALQQAADELDVAADLYEEAGLSVLAGTLHERARHARQADYRKLAAYGH